MRILALFVNSLEYAKRVALAVCVIKNMLFWSYLHWGDRRNGMPFKFYLGKGLVRKQHLWERDAYW